jgi:hypothetical protein
MASRLEYAQAFGPNVNRWYVVIPTLSHEGQPIRRIRNNRIDRAIRKGLEYVETVAVV